MRKDISEDRVKILMRLIDTNGSGHIDYTEFLVAGIDHKKSLTEHHFEQAFQYFDIDHSGAITF
jgi:Ca2+-binding EF-hand superfamily protein